MNGQLGLFDPPMWPCIDGCTTTSTRGDERTGIEFCGRHGWWPTWRIDRKARP